MKTRKRVFSRRVRDFWHDAMEKVWGKPKKGPGHPDVPITTEFPDPPLAEEPWQTTDYIEEE